MGKKQIVIGLVAGSAAVLGIVLLSKKENREKLSKAFSGVCDLLATGLDKIAELKNSVTKTADDLTENAQ